MSIIIKVVLLNSLVLKMLCYYKYNKGFIYFGKLYIIVLTLKNVFFLARQNKMTREFGMLKTAYCLYYFYNTCHKVLLLLD